MKRQYFSAEKDGFYGAYYPNKTECEKAVLCMIGDSVEDRMVKGAVKWIHDPQPELP